MSEAGEIIVRGLEGGAVRVMVEAGCEVENETVSARVERAWEEMRRANPRLHDGVVLLVDVERLRRGEVVCRNGSYKTLATAGVLGRPVRALGVCGVVVGRDVRGNEHVLFGRRSLKTRVYGGMWENAPSGVVSVRDGAESVGLEELTAALREEGVEELGVDLRGADVRAVATLEDVRACSVDVVLRVEVRGVIDPHAGVCAPGACGRWEYVDAAWVRVGEIGAWVRASGEGVSPPTRELIKWMGVVKRTGAL